MLSACTIPVWNENMTAEFNSNKMMLLSANLVIC